ncbi:hypothetical protein GW17_00050323, partial [Ensete ventricosum]
FTRRFAEGIGKLAGNMLGDCWKKIEKLTVRMSKAIGLAGIRRRDRARNTPGDHWKKIGRLTARMLEAAGLVGVNHPYPDVRAAEPRRSAGKPPVPSFFGMFDFLLQFRKPLEGLVFTQGRSVVDAGVPQEEGVGSGRRPLVSNH